MLSELCLRSKAVWGYEPAFIEACRPVLSYTSGDLAETSVVLAETDAEVGGTAQVARRGPEGAELVKLFVAPEVIGSGLGRTLFGWAVTAARALGAGALSIKSDPFAATFYERMGAVRVGNAPSSAIPGRRLPVLRLDLPCGSAHPTARGAGSG